MGSLWATGDVQTQNRRNREAIIGRLQLPVYDVDNLGVVRVTSKSIDGATLTGSSATYYTAPGITIVESLTLFNSDSTARAVTVRLIHSGGADDATTTIWADTLQPGETMVLSGPWFLNAGSLIKAFAATTSVVTLRGEVLELSANPGGVSLKQIDAGALATSENTYYTCPAITHALLLGVTLCNTDTLARLVTVWVSPTGTSSSTLAQQIYGESMLAKASTFLNLATVLEPGDFVAMKAATGSVVGARLTVVEFT